MDEEFELETANFVNDQNKDGFEVPLGENEDPASDDDDMGRGFLLNFSNFVSLKILKVVNLKFVIMVHLIL